MSHRRAALIGASLGVFQGAALGGTFWAVVLVVLDHLWLASLMVLMAVLGWWGWYRDFDLKWRPWGD